MICMINISAAAKQDIGDLCVNCSADGGGMFISGLTCVLRGLHHWMANVPHPVFCVLFWQKVCIYSQKTVVSPLILGGTQTHEMCTAIKASVCFKKVLGRIVKQHLKSPSATPFQRQNWGKCVCNATAPEEDSNIFYYRSNVDNATLGLTQRVQTHLPNCSRNSHKHR